MIIEKKDMTVEEIANLRNGNGNVIKETIASSEQSVHQKLFAKFTLNKDCSIGEHSHVGEIEYYYILSGEGIVSENDGEKIVKTGDVVITGWGNTHAIRNEKEEPLVFVAVILTEK